MARIAAAAMTTSLTQLPTNTSIREMASTTGIPGPKRSLARIFHDLLRGMRMEKASLPCRLGVCQELPAHSKEACFDDGV